MNRLVKLVLPAVILILVSPGHASAQTPTYKFKAINVANSVDTNAYGINDDGAIVGTFATLADNNAGVEHGWVRSESGRIRKPLDAPNSFDTDANGINDEGTIVGTFAPSDGLGGSLNDRCFIREEGEYTLFDVPLGNGDFPDCNGINNHGDTVGSVSTGVGGNHGWLRTRNGAFTQLDVLGATNTEATGINDKGHVVGFYQTSGSGDHGFIWINGTFTTFDILGASSTTPFGINNHDEIVGSYTDSVSDHGFLRTRNGTFHTVDVTLPNEETNAVRGINNDGLMVGVYTDNNGQNQGFTARRRDD
jgi:probable HAF family extracellular repeat protein